jgi:hypothetical protein
MLRKMTISRMKPNKMTLSCIDVSITTHKMALGGMSLNLQSAK